MRRGGIAHSAIVTLVSLNLSLTLFSLQCTGLTAVHWKSKRKWSHLEPVVCWLAPAQVSSFGQECRRPQCRESRHKSWPACWAWLKSYQPHQTELAACQTTASLGWWDRMRRRKQARQETRLRWEPPWHVRAVAPEEAVGGYAAGRRCGQSKEVSLGNSLDQWPHFPFSFFIILPFLAYIEMLTMGEEVLRCW